MNTLKDRLEELMAEYGLDTQQQLADFAGVSKGLVGQWFNGSTGLGAKPLSAFDKKTRFSINWLTEGTGDKYKTHVLPAITESESEDRIRFPRLNAEATCGAGTINDHYIEVVDYVTVASAWAREKLGGNLKKIQVITARGDSMEPTIENGDVGLTLVQMNKEASTASTGNAFRTKIAQNGRLGRAVMDFAKDILNGGTLILV